MASLPMTLTHLPLLCLSFAEFCVKCEPALNIDQGFRASCKPKQQVAAPVGVQSARRFTRFQLIAGELGRPSDYPRLLLERRSIGARCVCLRPRAEGYAPVQATAR
jgi:hypothetical protein